MGRITVPQSSRVKVWIDKREGEPFTSKNIRRVVEWTNQNPKTKIKMKTTRENGEDPLCSEIPELLQEFRENLVDDRVPERRDSHASSSHERSLEPVYEKWGFGCSQCLYSLPERPKLRDLPEDQNHKGPVQKTHWQSHTSCRKFWWFAYSRSQSSWWQLRISKQSPICSRGAGLSHPTDPVVSVQDKKLLRKRKGACRSSWSQIGSLNSFSVTISFECGKACEDLFLESL